MVAGREEKGEISIYGWSVIMVMAVVMFIVFMSDLLQE